MSLIHCQDCTYWRENESQDLAGAVSGEARKGACYRHPPHVQLAGGQDMAGQMQMATIPYRPPTVSTDGCGDGESRPPLRAS